MTTEQIKEAIAKAFESYRLGKDGNTATEAAAAVMALVGPKPLVWEYPSDLNNYCTIARTPRGDYYVDICGGRHQAWMESLTKPYEVQIGEQVENVYSAKAAAQSHADAAHWANTPLADMIEGKE